MFICSDCRRLTEPGELQYKLITKRREVAYNNNGVASKGWEIVKEEAVCSECFDSSFLNPAIAAANRVISN
jgi:hypothetical protein